MIELTQIGKIYQTDSIETIAVSDINLHIKKGEFVSVMGPSGCGKSTLLNIIGLLDTASSGEIKLEGESTDGMSEKVKARVRNEKLGFIFQSFHLIHDLNVLDNVELPLLYRKLPAKVRKSKAREALELVGLNARIRHYPGQLSGGQRQRVAIARAIVGQPSILLADEPTGNLDSSMGQEIIDILLDLNKNYNTSIVMVTHDEKVAAQTNRILRLFDGQLVN